MLQQFICSLNANLLFCDGLYRALEEDVDQYEYHLLATDSDGDRISTGVTIHVKDNPQLRRLNHRVHMELKLHRPEHFPTRVRRSSSLVCPFIYLFIANLGEIHRWAPRFYRRVDTYDVHPLGNTLNKMRLYMQTL